MSEPRAIAGDFADFKIVKTRSVAQIVVEIPIEEGESAVRLFGIPQAGKPVRLALARLNAESEVVSDRPVSGTGNTKLAGDKKAWADLPPAQQAGIRCAEPAFQRFLREQGDASCDSTEKAAAYVRFACGVKSRADIGKSNAAVTKWRDLDRRFQVWLSSPVDEAAA